ncbi:MAG: hypothetical protein GY765_23935, partial [bacterium]|nr:hypothetical protein [bacterium]
MKHLVDMNNRNDIGMVDWEFIHDMQGIIPRLITPELISLTKEFLDNIPDKWNEIKSRLASHVAARKTVYAAIADVENLGDE